MLQTKFPQGKVEKYEYFKGWPLVYFYQVPAGSPCLREKPGGIKGIYRLTNDWSGPSVLNRVDPVLNFTFRNDFGLGNFKTFSVRWSGSILASKPGPYSFLFLTTDEAVVWVDGRKILEGKGDHESVLFLKAGRHPLRVDFRKSSGVDTVFNFLWKVPGTQDYRVVPFWLWNQ